MTTPHILTISAAARPPAIDPALATCPGVLWFRTHDDFHRWSMAVAGYHMPFDQPYVTLATGAFQVHFTVVIAEILLDDELAAPIKLIDVPVSGFNKAEVDSFLQAQVDPQTIAWFHLLEPDDLSIAPHQVAPSQRAYQTIVGDIDAEARPFFCEDHPDFYPVFQQWLALVVESAVLYYQQRQLEQAQDNILAFFAHSEPILEQGIQSITALSSQVRVQETETEMQQQLHEIYLTMNAIKPRIAARREAAQNLAWNDGVIYSHGSPIAQVTDLGIKNFGAFTEIIAEAKTLALQLHDSTITELQNIAKAIDHALDQPQPILTLMGLFSSGKTTFVNALLAGSNKIRVFATSSTRNTAMIVQIKNTSARPKNSPYKEYISYTFAEDIAFTFISLDPVEGNKGGSGHTFYKLNTTEATNMATLSDFMRDGIVTDCAVIVEPSDENAYRITDPVEILKIFDFLTDIQSYPAITQLECSDALRAYWKRVYYPEGRYTFHATITPTGITRRIEEGRLYETIDLVHPQETFSGRERWDSYEQ